MSKDATFYFYRRGWRGIKLDLPPSTERRFPRLTPHDITLRCGVAAKPDVLSYHVFNDRAPNTVPVEAAVKKAQGEHRLIAWTRALVRRRRDDPLNQHMFAGTAIDFTTVGTERLDFEMVVLNNRQRDRPRCELVELLDTCSDEILTYTDSFSPADHGYLACAESLKTVFFMDNRGAAT